MGWGMGVDAFFILLVMFCAGDVLLSVVWGVDFMGLTYRGRGEFGRGLSGYCQVSYRLRMRFGDFGRGDGLMDVGRLRGVWTGGPERGGRWVWRGHDGVIGGWV